VACGAENPIQARDLRFHDYETAMTRGTVDLASRFQLRLNVIRGSRSVSAQPQMAWMGFWARTPSNRVPPAIRRLTPSHSRYCPAAVVTGSPSGSH
jgi:hypothetical protein